MFKVGDKVRCIEEGGNRDFKIKNGKIYTISEIGSALDSGLIYLKEHPLPGSGWYAKRFELVTEEKNVTPKKSNNSDWGF